MTQKEYLEEKIKYTIPLNLELKKSNLHGIGIFAKVFIPKNTIFKSKTIIINDDSIKKEFKDYYWEKNTLIDGIGYFCNGSCEIFERYPEETKIGPYITKNINIIRIENEDKTYSFKTIKDIQKNQELILKYSNAYFHSRLRNIGIYVPYHLKHD